MVRMEQTQQEEEENNQCCFTEMGDLAAVFMGDAFRIEDLAEFSNEDIAGPISSNSLSSCLSGSSPQHSINGFSCPHFLPDDLAVICPSYTDTGLEWLTSFTEDSTAPSNATNDSGSSSVAEEAKQSSDTGQDEQQQKRKAREVPGRARSKRPRTSLAHSLVCSWSCTSLTRNDREEEDEPEAEEQETVTMEVEKKSSRTGQQPRRCTHCLSQRTPQWRAGPLGPKTLCNACGVRYKSGRLFPEYRPAKSPTFVRYIHSNSHKKVLEMRSQQDQSHSDFNHLNPNLSPTMIPIRQFPAQVSTNSSPLKLKFKLAAGSPV